MKKKRMVCLILVGMLVMSQVLISPVYAEKKSKKLSTDWPTGPKNISAKSAIVMELSTGTVLYEKNVHAKQYPASITKIMTTLLCLENASLTDTVTYSKEAVFGIEPGSSHISLTTGEKLTMEESLYGIMLMSANEACLGVAEHISGTVPKFVDLMNERAKSLGCTDTHFNNPNGLFDKKHYTSAYDMALISREAMKNSVFRKITGTKRYDIPATNKNTVRNLYNKHQMLYPRTYPQYAYDYCIGGKTGYTDLARWTLVTFAKKDGMELVCVVMRTEGPPPNEPNEYTDTIKLLNFSFENFKKHEVGSAQGQSEDGDVNPLFTRYNPLFDQTNSPLRLQDSQAVILPTGIDASAAVQSTEYYDNVSLKTGENVIGKVSYSFGTRQVGASNIIYDTSESVRLKGNEQVENIIRRVEEKQKKAEEKAKKTESKKSAKKEDSSNWIVWAIVGVIALLTAIINAILFLTPRGSRGGRRSNLPTHTKGKRTFRKKRKLRF